MLKIFKTIFSKIADAVGGSIDELALMFVSIAILGAFIAYSVLAFIIAKSKRRNCCACGVIQLNRVGNLFWSIVAMVFVAFSIFVYIGGGVLLISAFAFAWISGFLLTFFIIMLVFMVLSYNADRCGAGCKAAKALPPAPEVPLLPAPEVLLLGEKSVENDQKSAKKDPKSAKKGTKNDVKSTQNSAQNAKSEVAPGAGFEVAGDARAESAARGDAGATSAAVEQGEVRPSVSALPGEKPAKAPARRAAGGRPSATKRTAVAARETARVAVRTAARQKTDAEIAIEKKNERIEELAAKIERQRLRAAKSADTVTVSDVPYAAQTRGGFQTVGDAADKMDALQRRMDMLRKTIQTREVVTTEAVKKVDVTTRTVSDLRQEQQTLQRHYTTLENMSHTPTKNKYNAEEVQIALQSLKAAMTDLQRQIDKHERN